MKKKILIAVVVILLIPVVIYFGFPGILYNMSVNKKRKAAGLEVKTIEAAGHTVSCLEGGKGPVVLLIHGLGGDKDNWSDFSVPLTMKYRVIALDMPGSGESSQVIDAIYSITAQVQRLEKIVETLKLDKFHLVGTAMGGTIAGRYTVLNPDRVLSLAFFNTEGLPSAKESEYDKVSLKKNPLQPANIEEFDTMLKFLFIEPPSIPGPVKKYLFKKSVAAREFNMKIFWDVYGEGYSLEPDLAKIKVPTLILWGNKDNKLHVSGAKVLERGLPDSTTIIMEGAGHFMMRQKPAETARHYLSFISAK